MPPHLDLAEVRKNPLKVPIHRGHDGPIDRGVGSLISIPAARRRRQPLGPECPPSPGPSVPGGPAVFASRGNPSRCGESLLNGRPAVATATTGEGVTMDAS